MSRTVNGEPLFGDSEKEVLRKMLWQVADFSGVQVLTYALMDNHFHVLVRVSPSKLSTSSPPRSRSCSGGDGGQAGLVISDEELMRRWRRLYPKPTKYETITAAVMERTLAEGGEKAEAIRQRLLARMGDVSEFMKTLKQRITIWYNRSHDRFGPLWADRFKSVLVEGQGNPLQTMAAYIDLNPVRAGIVEDPKDYRFCGYAEAVACHRSSASADMAADVPSYGQQSQSTDPPQGSYFHQDSGGEADVTVGKAASASSGQLLAQKWTAAEGICLIWQAYVNGPERELVSMKEALRMHRELIFGKRAGTARLSEAERKEALRVLEKERGVLPMSTVLRCRVRYFTDGVILGSEDFVRNFAGSWQRDKRRKHRPKPIWLRGADWEGLTVMLPLRRQVFG